VEEEDFMLMIMATTFSQHMRNGPTCKDNGDNLKGIQEDI
jgi:hypothetical protein